MYKIIEKVEIERRVKKTLTYVLITKYGQLHFSSPVAELIKEQNGTFNVMMVQDCEGNKLYAIQPNTEGGYEIRTEKLGQAKTNASNLCRVMSKHYNLEKVLESFNSYRFDVEIDNGLIILLAPKKYGSK
jgi:hypothetical protein